MKNTDNPHTKVSAEALDALRKEVEAAIGKQMHSAHDFDMLSNAICEKLQERLSVNTLKRLWGYLDNDVQPRETTLDILAKFVNFQDWNDFTKNHTPADREETTATDILPTPHGWSRRKKRLTVLFAGIGLIIIAFAAYGLRAFIQRNTVQHKDDSKYIIRMGDRFSTYDSYLSRFGIKATERKYSQPLPHHAGIVVFGGEYHHPNWGNEGDPGRLLPTRTEHWHDDNATPEVEVMQNRQHYYAQWESNRLNITFMKNLVDTGFVFCGVYRMSLEQSDTTHVVWERVAEEIDLRHLDYLERFRN